jgi:hypothetical protein
LCFARPVFQPRSTGAPASVARKSGLLDDVFYIIVTG